MKLQRNMGSLDQGFRILMGIALIYIGPFSDIITNDTLSSILLVSVATMIIISSLIGWCPFYYLAGLSSYRAKSDNS